MLPGGVAEGAVLRAPDWSVGSWSTSAPDARTFSNVVVEVGVRNSTPGSEPLVSSVSSASPSVGRAAGLRRD